MKALFGLYSDFGVADINRLLKPHGVRLVLKKSKDWGKNVSVTAHAVGVPTKRSRTSRQTAPPVGGDAPAGAVIPSTLVDATKPTLG